MREIPNTLVCQEINMKVYVYYNLHRKCWSLRCREPGHPQYGRVIAHRDRVYLTDVEFKVSEAGRQRVLREGRKNVHAGVVGRLATDCNHLGNQVTYNPYQYDSFVYRETGTPVTRATGVAMLYGRVYEAKVG